jgi:hypothetical protein
LILEESEKLYNKLTTELTNSVKAAIAVVIRESSLPIGSNNNQKLTYKIDNAYQTDKSRYKQNRNL